MKNEKLPDPINLNSLIRDSVTLSLYRESINPVESKLITLPSVEFTGTPSSTYTFLPETIPQGIHKTEYIIKNYLNIIELSPTLFKFNLDGEYNYDISFVMNSDVIGKIIIQVIDENDTILDDGKFEIFRDSSTVSKTIRLINNIKHKKGDVSRIRFTGFKNGGGPINISISQIYIKIIKI